MDPVTFIGCLLIVFGLIVCTATIMQEVCKARRRLPPPKRTTASVLADWYVNGDMDTPTYLMAMHGLYDPDMLYDGAPLEQYANPWWSSDPLAQSSVAEESRIAERRFPQNTFLSAIEQEQYATRQCVEQAWNIRTPDQPDKPSDTIEFK